MKVNELLVPGWYWVRLHYSEWRPVQLVKFQNNWLEKRSGLLMTMDHDIIGPLTPPEN